MNSAADTTAILVGFVVVPSAGFVWPRDPFAMGAFEFTKKHDPMQGCEDALAQSLAAHGIMVDGSAVRLLTFFSRASRAEALRAARLYAKEVLTLMSQLTYEHVAPGGLRRAGYTFDLDRGVAQPILPHDYPDRRAPQGMLLMVDELARHPQLAVNTLLSVHPVIYGELGSAVRRSTHWSELARQADDQGERLLMFWMAAETLTRVSETETLAPKFMSSIGFVSGRYWTQLSTTECGALTALAEWETWRSRLAELLDRLRSTRNDIAHAGFREVDLRSRFDDDEWLVLRRIIPMIVVRLQGLATNALSLGITTIAGLWDRYADCMRLHRPISIAQDVQGNVLFRLKQPPGPFDE